MNESLVKIFIVAISLVLAGIFNSEMDTLSFNPTKSWAKKFPFIKNFWLRRLQTKSQFRKTILFFTLDGWHLCKGLQIYSLIYPSSFLLIGNIGLSFLVTIPLMMFLGAIFELSYKY